jgi:outer membrane protein OmpA-like peptidoglycan-associated protein
MHFKFLIITCFLFLCSEISFAQLYEVSEPIKLSESINTPAEESNPWILQNRNSKELYFVRTFDERNTGGKNDQDIWFSTLQRDGTWSIAKQANNLNNKNNNSIGSISPKKIYVLYSDKKNKSSAIKVSKINNSSKTEKWETPELPGFDLGGIKLANEEIGFTVSKDEKFLILSLQESAGFGMEDLYIFDISKSKLSSLGPEINSKGYEISPFLNETSDTLFFTSNGLGGEGDADIFYSVRGKDITEWSKPVNMGKKINSSGFDAYFAKFGNTVYWSSNRSSEDANLYTAEIIRIPKLEITLTGTNITVFDGNDGKINLTVKGGKGPYKYKWSNSSETEDISTLKKGKYYVVVTDFYGQSAKDSIELTEPPTVVQKIIRLPEVRYVLDSWKFINNKNFSSFDSLDLLASMLNNHPEIAIELISHTDSRGDNKKNQVLSQNRSRAVFTYLVKKKGIDARRLIPVGKGESEPSKIFDQKTNSMLILTESYINNFKKNSEEFERLHQINRRTEGKIIDINFKPDSKVKIQEGYFIEIE